MLLPTNHGKGETFSPTDLLATALGSCMITIAGIAARSHGFDIDDTQLEITKIMASDPRRVSEVIIEIYLPFKEYSSKQRAIIEKACLYLPGSFKPPSRFNTDSEISLLVIGYLVIELLGC